ncbi:MAG: SOS response-associated peptidase [Candidatus Saccharimonadales bacterium]
MCGRYTLNKTASDIAKHYSLVTVPQEVKPNFNVAPTQTMPVIIDDGKGPTMQLMKWGIPRFIGPGKVKDVFNTRDDKAFGSWKKLTLNTRCLIPATGYYEWKTISYAGKPTKHPFYFHPKDMELFSFAGVWNIWQDKDSDRQIKVYSIMTTEPNREAATVHNRMPVILHQADEPDWVSSAHNNDQSELESLLRPLKDDALELYEVSRDVNTTKINNDGLMLPLNSQ